MNITKTSFVDRCIIRPREGDGPLFGEENGVPFVRLYRYYICPIEKMGYQSVREMQMSGRTESGNKPTETHIMNKEFIEALKEHLLQYARRVWPKDLVDAVECINDHIDTFAVSWADSEDNELTALMEVPEEICYGAGVENEFEVGYAKGWNECMELKVLGVDSDLASAES